MWCSSSCQDTLIPKARIAAPFFVCGLVRDLEIWAFYHTPNAFFPFLSLYWCFDQKYVVKYVKETCGNVHSTPKETCDNATLLSSKNQLEKCYIRKIDLEDAGDQFFRTISNGQMILVAWNTGFEGADVILHV